MFWHVNSFTLILKEEFCRFRNIPVLLGQGLYKQAPKLDFIMVRPSVIYTRRMTTMRAHSPVVADGVTLLVPSE